MGSPADRTQVSARVELAAAIAARGCGLATRWACGRSRRRFWCRAGVAPEAGPRLAPLVGACVFVPALRAGGASPSVFTSSSRDCATSSTGNCLSFLRVDGAGRGEEAALWVFRAMTDSYRGTRTEWEDRADAVTTRAHFRPPARHWSIRLRADEWQEARYGRAWTASAGTSYPVLRVDSVRTTRDGDSRGIPVSSETERHAHALGTGGPKEMASLRRWPSRSDGLRWSLTRRSVPDGG